MTPLWDMLFPPVCIGCGMLGTVICEACETGVWEEEQICPCCGKNSRYEQRHSWCIDRKNITGLVCFWSYDGLIKKLVWKSKYSLYFDYLIKMTENSIGLMDRPEMERIVEFIKEKPEIVPVPMYREKQKMRGFNQAEIIGRVLGKKFKLAINNNLLARSRETQKLSGKSRAERFQIVNGAFYILEKTRIPKKVILVDDIWTTGATMNECADTLKRSGVKDVWGIVLSR